MRVKGVSAGRVLVLIQAASLASPQNSLRSFRGAPPAPPRQAHALHKRKELKRIESTTDAGFALDRWRKLRINRRLAFSISLT
jgi:hypothetical protein